MTKPKPPHLLQKVGRKPLPPEQHKHWTLLELRERCFVTLTDCWEWRSRDGKIPPKEHGRRFPTVTHGGQNVSVRRVAWELATGRKLAKSQLLVPMKCGNPRCQNPWHAKPMSEKEKTRLAVSRGAFSTPARRRAVAHAKRAQSKTGMTLEKAQRIRSIAGPAHAHCHEFGISAGMFNRIRSGKAWMEL